MAYDILLADRIRELIFLRTAAVEEKPMFGGLCFMVNSKMCVTTRDDRIWRWTITRPHQRRRRKRSGDYL